MKVLLLLALTIFTAVSTIASVAVAANISIPNSFSITKTIAKSTGFGDTQPNGGDPVEGGEFPH